jgi:hypothetical protein
MFLTFLLSTFDEQNKTFEKQALEKLMLFGGYDYDIRITSKAFLTEIIFIGWMKFYSKRLILSESYQNILDFVFSS